MKSFLKKLVYGLSAFILILNVIAFIHAYKFTHFTTTNVSRTKDPSELTFVDKIKTLAMGIDNPKSQPVATPTLPFETVTLYSEDSIKCWHIKTPTTETNGTVILFHGYAGEKSSLLNRSEQFLTMGYNVLLVDFIGAGESGGYTTSVGFHEAAQVRTCFDYLARHNEKNIYLFGTSMGAAAILKAIHDNNIHPTAIILECPFGSLYKTVCARFDIMNVPPFPMALLLTFWGGVQNGYWAFDHNPTTYAKSVTCPTLLLFGAQDDRVSLLETKSIFENLKGPKTLKVYPQEGHQVFTAKNSSAWINDVAAFLQSEAVQQASSN